MTLIPRLIIRYSDFLIKIAMRLRRTLRDENGRISATVTGLKVV